MWILIPPGACASVCCECCVLSGRGLCVGLITFPEDVCGVSECDCEAAIMRRPWPNRGSSTMEKIVYRDLGRLFISSSSSSVICQTTGPKPLPKRFLHIVRSRASSFNRQYPLLSLRSPRSFLRLLPRLLVTPVCPFIFPSITCCRRQFLRKM